MLSTLIKRAMLAAVFVAGIATTAQAQYTPTPEGTVITNTATASYTDARGNTYAGLTSSVDITVGHYPALTNVGAAASPAEGSDGNWASFTLTNIGNGLDRFQVVSSSTNDAAAITLTGNYRIGTGTSVNLADLNTALLALAQTAVNGTVEIQVQYNVLVAGAGDNIQLVARSDRAGGLAVAPAIATGTALITTGAGAYAVTVVPTTATVSEVAGGTYTATYTVTNTSASNGSFVWDLGATATDGTVSFGIVSITGAGVAGNQVTLAKDEDVLVTVTYTIPNNVAVPAIVGSAVPVVLTATRNGETETGSGTTTVTVTNPVQMAVLKTVTLDDGSPVGATVTPGTILRYTIRVTAAAGEPVTDVTVVDPLHADLELIDATNGTSSGGGASNFVIDTTTTPGTVSATIDGDVGTPALAAAAWKELIIRVTLKIPTP